MPKCTSSALRLSSLGRRVVEADFDGGAITSDAGAVWLREVERRTGLLRGLARRVDDERHSRRCRHDLGALLCQRVFASALGYEDLNDHQALRADLAFQTAVSRDEPLASASTLCRLEQRADPGFAWAAHDELLEQFVAAFDSPPQRLTLDFDATDDRVYGEQIGRHFSGYYDGYCFLPLYVFCGEHLLVRRLRACWPGVEIVLRGDRDFCTPRLLLACQRLEVDYVLGFSNNAWLKRRYAPLLDMAEALQTLSGHRQPVRFHERPGLVGEPVPAARRQPRLHADHRPAPPGAGRHPLGASQPRAAARAAVENRRGDPPQHPSGATAPGQPLPRARAVAAARPPPRAGMSPAQCCPGASTNNGGKGVVCPQHPVLIKN